MAKRYTDEEKANAYAMLELNQNNILRTARDTGIPRPTIQTWVRGWKKTGVPEVIQELAQREYTDFVEVAEDVRDKAITKLRELIPHATVKDMRSLTILVGVTDDKIRLAKGLATSRTEKRIELPSPDQMKELIRGMVGGAIEAQKERDNDIHDVIDYEEIIPKGELPSGE